MSTFDTLLLGHLVGDYLFQTSWMSYGKKKHFLPLFVHSSIYTLCIFLFTFNTDFMSWSNYLIVWAAHLLIDNRKFTLWWTRTVMRVGSDGSDKGSWLTIVVDQVFHLLVFYILLL